MFFVKILVQCVLPKASNFSFRAQTPATKQVEIARLYRALSADSPDDQCKTEILKVATSWLQFPIVPISVRKYSPELQQNLSKMDSGRADFQPSQSLFWIDFPPFWKILSEMISKFSVADKKVKKVLLKNSWGGNPNRRRYVDAKIECSRLATPGKKVRYGFIRHFSHHLGESVLHYIGFL